MDFKLNFDWYLEDFFDKIKIYDAGSIFRPNEEGFYHIKGLGGREHFMSLKDMKGAKLDGEFLFSEYQSINIEIGEVSDDLEIKKWRIQLDVNTSLSNLKKIQRFLEENIPLLL